jgi:hypothetical protein
MGRNIWHFTETECQKSIKRHLRISVIAEAVLSEPFFMPVMTAILDSLFHAAAETGIALHVSSINQRSGCINKWKTFYLLIIFF